MGLQDVPAELLISIFHDLSLVDLHRCMATCRFIHDVIKDSIELQYQMELEMHGMVHNPNCRLDVAECLLRLRRQEAAWRSLTPSFERTIRIQNNASGIYELSGGTYFLGASGASQVPFLRLPTDPTAPATWDSLQVEGKIVDIGISLFEHDLFAAIVMCARLFTASRSLD